MKLIIPIAASDVSVWFDVRFLYASHGGYQWRIWNSEGGMAYASSSDGHYSWDENVDILRLPFKARHLIGRALQVHATVATGNGQSDMVGIKIHLSREVEPARATSEQRIQEIQQIAHLSEGQIAHFDFALAFKESDE